MISRLTYNFRVFSCFGLILWLMLPSGVSAAREVAVIQVEHRWAAELVPIVESILSPNGTVTVSERVNSLVIMDTPDAIERVRAYLGRFDRPVEQVRIHVRFHATGMERDSDVSVRGRISNDNASVAVGGKKKDDFEVSVAARNHRQNIVAEFFVLAMSGSPAYIRTGKEIPYHQNSAFFRRYAPSGGTVTWQNVESGFEVTPTIAGENAHLKIVPRIAYDDRKDAVVRFFGARTEVAVTLGQWVEIGGATNQNNEITREIIALGRNSEKTSTTMSLMVERP